MQIIIFLLMALGFVLGVVVLVALAFSLAALAHALLPVARVPFRYTLRNLQVRWKTTLVTAFAFTVVVALLTFMLAFVKGMNQLTEGSGQPGNVVILSDGATDEAFSNLPGGISVPMFPKDVQTMVRRDGDKYWAVKEVYVIVNQEIANAGEGERKRRFVQMRGIDDPELAARIHAIELAEGTWFSGRTHEVVLGDGVARTFGKDLGKERAGPGDKIKIGPREWLVVGTMQPSASAFGSEVWAQDTQVGKSFGRDNSYSSYVVRVKDAKQAENAAALIKKERAAQAFAAMTELEYYAKLAQTSQQFLYAIMIVAIVMAVGGVLGVMNTMFAAISNRTKDIGVLRILGYSRWQILMSFLLESLLIGLLGGLLGCALGYLSDGITTSSVVSSGQGGGKSVVLKLVVDVTILAAGMGVAWIMGAVGGLFPSLSAMRLKPLESLR